VLRAGSALQRVIAALAVERGHLGVGEDAVGIVDGDGIVAVPGLHHDVVELVALDPGHAAVADYLDAAGVTGREPQHDRVRPAPCL